MSLQDIATAAKHNIPVIIFCMNNSLYGLIRQQQNWFYNERQISTDLIYKNELCDNEERKKHARKTDYTTLPIRQERALQELREFLDRDAFVSHDCGISQIWSFYNLFIRVFETIKCSVVRESTLCRWIYYNFN